MFANRSDAGRQLAQRLMHLKTEGPIVVGLPRGGVPVAFEVATTLDAPLDVILVRKLGVPYQPELAMGAIGEGGVRVINHQVMHHLDISPEQLARVEEAELRELERRGRAYRGDRERLDFGGRTVVVIDDGIATGSTARAACQVVKLSGAARAVLAIPVLPATSVSALADAVDELVWVAAPRHLIAIGEFYRDFSPTRDDEVTELLARAAHGLKTE